MVDGWVGEGVHIPSEYCHIGGGGLKMSEHRHKGKGSKFVQKKRHK